MGWNSANRIFDPVARTLIETGVDPAVKRRVLADLIKELQDGDWDTEDESLEDFLHDPAVVQAFADRDVHLSDRSCCRAEHAGNPRQQLIAMRAEDVSEAEMATVLDAYTHQLAELIRDGGEAVKGATQASKVIAYAADLIDRGAQR